MSSTTTIATHLPNPFTPLAFLLPNLAEQSQALTYVCLAVFSVSLCHGCVSLVDPATPLGVYMGLGNVDSRRNSNVSYKKIPSVNGHVLSLSVSTESAYFQSSYNTDTLLELGRS